jgi:Amt family ammonium transporter
MIPLIMALTPRVALAAGAADYAADGLVVLMYLLPWLMPLGLALVAAGVGGVDIARRVALALPLALAAALVGYTVCGFAFHLGGVGLVLDGRGLAGLSVEVWPGGAGPGWGLLGLRGFLFSIERATPQEIELFLTQLALVTTAALIPLTTLAGRVRPLRATALALLVATVTYPLAGNWVQGGGWLAHLGATLGLGHGLVDYGMALPHLVGGCAALAGLLVSRAEVPMSVADEPELPATHLPLGVLAGAVLLVVGWFATLVAQPLISVRVDAARLLLNALWAVAGATLASYAYGWLAQGEPDLGLTGRAMVAAVVAVSAGLAFYTTWTALLLGALAGALLAPAAYLVEHVLGLDDDGAAVAVHGLPALGGLLAVGLLADGRRGVGWNAAASGHYAAWDGGVAGLITSGDTGQLVAQVMGVGAIVLVAVLLPWGLLTVTGRAVALPRAARRQARAGAARWRQEAGVDGMARPAGVWPWQRAHAAVLRSAASPDRRLLRRPRRLASQRPQTSRTAMAGVSRLRRRSRPTRG